MAQWSHSDRTLYAKIVYYGPAFGGKTTNLESLHRITDPDQCHKLLSVKTADDRTLFFDLLPFDLGDVLGYQVALKLYTVPGQVRYEATRKVVLSGADAVVFVADSSRSREEQNRWSRQNLLLNLHALRIDPARIPIVYQFNKQDLAEAAAPDEVARWLSLPPGMGRPAVATTGQGVIETFVAAGRATIERIVRDADARTLQDIDVRGLDRRLDATFRPYLEQASRLANAKESASATRPGDVVIVGGDELLQESVRTSLELGERLVGERSRGARHERELEALRRLNESLRATGASFDRRAIVDAALKTLCDVLELSRTTLVTVGADDACRGAEGTGGGRDPLLAVADGRALIRRMTSAARPCVVDDLAAESPAVRASAAVAGVNAVAVAPIDASHGEWIVAYAAAPDRRISPEDLRFLDTVAGHLAAGLEKSRLHSDLASHSDRLESAVVARTSELRAAYVELRGLEELKDRFVTNLSHEMKTPLTAVLSGAVALRDYDVAPPERKEIAAGVVHAAEALQRLLDDLFRVTRVDSAARPPVYAPVTIDELLQSAIALSGRPAPLLHVGSTPTTIVADRVELARAIANLLDNAYKFSSGAASIELASRPTALVARELDDSGVEFVVSDRGVGVASEDRARIFEPFEQGGRLLTNKPSGVGLGLYESRGVARRHGGELEYRPREGGGSEFRLVVPREPVPSAAAVVEGAHA